MTKISDNVLTVHRFVRRVEGGKGVKYATDARIAFGGMTVAKVRGLGGSYSNVQVLREFKINPKRWEKGEAYELARSAGLVA